MHNLCSLLPALPVGAPLQNLNSDADWLQSFAAADRDRYLQTAAAKMITMPVQAFCLRTQSLPFTKKPNSDAWLLHSFAAAE